MRDRCAACGRPIVLVNIDRMRGVIGLTYGWVHAFRWVRHAAIPPSTVED